MATARATEKRKAVCFTCVAQCGLVAHLEDGRVMRLIGDKGHSRTRGFVCPKGARAHELHYAPDRIHQPLRRVGPRGAGNWEAVSWDDAMADIAVRIEAIATSAGPEAVAHGFGTLHSSDYSIGRRFLNLLGSPNSIGQDKICSGPIALGEFLTYGFGPTGGPAVPGVTGCVMIWGWRPIESARPSWDALQPALQAGTKLLVIDPEHTKEAKRADLWLQPIPGTDATLGLGILHAVIEGGLYDKEFVERETVGFEALRKRVSKYPPEQVEEVTGVPAHQIRAAATMIGAATPTLFAGGNGLCQSGASAVQNGRVLACLVAVTGNLNRPGGQPLAGPPRDLLGNADWMATMANPREQRVKALGATAIHCIGEGYEQLDEAVSAAWYGKRGVGDWLGGAHEPALWRAILEEDPYPVKALVLQYHNPVGGSANSGEVERALRSEKLELLVCHDLFLNATTRFADYLLPAAHWLEKPFLSFGAGPIAASGDVVEAAHATLEPEHGHRSDYDFWCDLGHRLGQGEHWPPAAEAFYQTLLDPAGLRFDDVAVHNGPLTGAAARHPDHAEVDPPDRFGTPSGKVELASSLLESWGEDPLPHPVQARLFEHADVYPLVLTSGGRQIEGFHQNAQQLPIFREANPEPYVRVHPQTADHYGLREGEWVAIETPVARVEQQLRIDEGLPVDVVHAERWWYPEGCDDRDDPYGIRRTSINMCTSNAPGDVDPIMGTWLMRGLPCRLAPRQAEGHER